MTANVLESHSPQAPSDIVGAFPLATTAEVQAAVLAARDAQREWWALGAGGRSAALAGAAGALRDVGRRRSSSSSGRSASPSRGERRGHPSDRDPRVLRAGVLRGDRLAVPAVGREPAVHPAAPTRRRGADHAVELPAGDPAVEGRPGARRGERGGAQTLPVLARVWRTARFAVRRGAPGPRVHRRARRRRRRRRPGGGR